MLSIHPEVQNFGDEDETEITKPTIYTKKTWTSYEFLLLTENRENT